MSDQQWRVLDSAGNEHGPYSFQDLQGYYTTGNITHETLVWTEGLTDWTPAGNIQDLLPDAPLPVVPLAEATPAHAGPPESAGGINLNPQAGVSNSSGVAGGQKQGAPTWLSITTIAIGLTTLILFFFPWVSADQDLSFTVNENVETIFTQTGIQSISGEISSTDAFISWLATALGVPEDVIREKGAKRGEKTDENSTFNLIAIIIIAISVVLALIGLLNKISTLTTIAQLCLAIAGLLIGIQMARQFPVIKSYSVEMKAANKQAQKEAKAEQQNPPGTPPAEKEPKATKASEDGDTAATDGEEAGSKKPSPKPATPTPAKGETITVAKKVGVYFETSFEPSCYVTVGLLASAIFLLVITMSSSNSTPLIIPQGGFQSSQAGEANQQAQQPQQPGAGLKFH